MIQQFDAADHRPIGGGNRTYSFEIEAALLITFSSVQPVKSPAPLVSLGCIGHRD